MAYCGVIGAIQLQIEWCAPSWSMGCKIATTCCRGTFTNTVWTHSASALLKYKQEQIVLDLQE